MESDQWLSNKDIETFAAELLTSEYAGRINNRLKYLFRNYADLNGIEMFDIMIDALSKYQRKIDNLINSNSHSILEETKLSVTKDIDKLHEIYTVPRIIIYYYSTNVRGVIGDITWNEIDKVKKMVIAYRNSLENNRNEVDTNESNHINKKNENEEIIESLDDLFLNQNHIKNYVDILRTISLEFGKPIIDENNRWLRGKKSIVIAWMDVLEEKGKMRVSVSNSKKSELLNKYFDGLDLNISETSLWRKTSSFKYKDAFKKVIQ